jgi:hypothetical protein
VDLGDRQQHGRSARLFIFSISGKVSGISPFFLGIGLPHARLAAVRVMPLGAYAHNKKRLLSLSCAPLDTCCRAQADALILP